LLKKWFKGLYSKAKPFWLFNKQVIKMEIQGIRDKSSGCRYWHSQQLIVGFLKRDTYSIKTKT